MLLFTGPFSLTKLEKVHAFNDTYHVFLYIELSVNFNSCLNFIENCFHSNRRSFEKNILTSMLLKDEHWTDFLTSSKYGHGQVSENY